ncbi:MAG: hypothetical protein IPF64_12780 [Flavobacteriales bacterium]|nr:hypothetical protein [Flavobacteriales bacterium]
MEHWIGIDESSATLDFALLDGKGTHLESVQIENDRKAVMKLMGRGVSVTVWRWARA